MGPTASEWARTVVSVVREGKRQEEGEELRGKRSGIEREGRGEGGRWGGGEGGRRREGDGAGKRGPGRKRRRLKQRERERGRERGREHLD